MEVRMDIIQKVKERKEVRKVYMLKEWRVLYNFQRKNRNEVGKQI